MKPTSSRIEVGANLTDLDIFAVNGKKAKLLPIEYDPNIEVGGGMITDLPEFYSNAKGWKKRREEKKKQREAKKAERAKKKAEKKKKRQEKRKERKEKGTGLLRKGFKAFKRFNPLSTTARAGVLAAFRVNLFGMTKRIYPAFLSDSEIAKGKFKKANAQKAKAQWTKLATFWEKKMGGKKSNLEKAIKSGHNKPIFRKKKASSFEGVFVLPQVALEGQGNQYADAILEQFDGRRVDIDEFSDEEQMMLEKIGKKTDDLYSSTVGADILAVIATAMPAIVYIVKEMTAGGLDKNPYEADSPEGKEYEDEIGEGETETPALDQAELDKITKAGEEDAEKGGEGEGIWGMPKMVVYIGGGIVGIGLIVLVASMLTKKKK